MKYSEALDFFQIPYTLKSLENEYSDAPKGMFDNMKRMCELLVEACEKASFVDDVANGRIKASMGRYGIMAMNKETYHKWCDLDKEPISKRFLLQENQALNEIQEEDKYWLDVLRKENEILKDGIKALLKHIDCIDISAKFVLMRFETYYVDINDGEDYNKIKTMLEVVKND